MTNQISISAPIPPKAKKAFALGIGMFSILLASYAINAMDRQIFPFLAADIRKQYDFTLADTGLLSTIFTLGMAIAGIPTAYLLARLPRKFVVQIGIAIFSIGTVLTAYSSGFTDMLLYRASTGIGEAMQLTALLAIAGSYFVRYRAAALGAVNLSFGIGAIVGPAFASNLLLSYQNWTVPMIVFGALGFVAMVLISIFVRPSLTEVDGSANRQASQGGAASLLNRNTILLTILSMIGGLVVYGYLGMYPTYLREALHFTPADTGKIMSIFGLGVLASIGGGWLGDRFSPRLVLSLAFLAAAVLGFLIFHGFTSFMGHAILSFIWGLVVSGTVYVNLAGYHVKAVNVKRASDASGLFVTSFYGTGAFAGYIIGSLAQQIGWSNAGIAQISILSIAGMLLAIGLRPSEMALIASPKSNEEALRIVQES
jgi:predicted MFS family arabinose efflux permease